MFRIVGLSIFTLFFSSTSQAQEKLEYETGATLTQKALALLEEENYNEAIETYRKISPNDSLYKSSFVPISYYLILQKEYDKALEAVNKGLEVADHTTQRDLYLNKGISYEGLERYDRAKAHYIEALIEYPRSHKLRYNLSRMNKELGEDEEAFTNTILALEANPFYEKAMLQLGNMYRKQDKRAQALLLYNLYLLFSPDGQNSFAVLKMANNMVGTISDIKGKTYAITEDDDLFETQNLIIESQLALQTDYEITNELNIPFTKQTAALLNQLMEEPFDGQSRFWAKQVVPFFKWIKENSQFDNLAYTTAYSIQKEDLKKVVTKKTEDVKTFLSIAYPKWTELSSQDSKYVEGAAIDVLRNYDNQGLLTGEGQLDKEGEPQGRWMYYNASGKIIARGNFSQGKREGTWEWYHENGRLKERGNYIAGLEEGTYEFFHDNGNKSSILNFKNGKLDQWYELYALSGALLERRTYNEGVMNGERRFFFNGDENQLKYEYAVKDDKANGPYKEFHPNGKLAKTFALVNDLSEGEENIYHYNGQLYATATYEKGLYEGPFTTFYPSGEKEGTGSYSKGEPNGEWINYYSDGVLFEKRQYDQGKFEGSYLSYDRDGDLLSDFYYDNGLIKEYTYFDKAGNSMESQKKKAGDLDFRGYDGARTLSSQGIYDIKGGKKGEWLFYNTYGVLKEKGNYQENLVEGTYTLYHPNGKIKDVSNYKNDVLEGYEVIYYPFGQINSQSYYKEGARDGKMISYHPNGTIKTENYYHKGLLNGEQSFFTPEGKRASTSLYAYGVLMSEVIFKNDGTILDEINKFSPKDGNITYHHENGKVRSSLTLKYELLDGPYKEFDYYGNLELEGHYVTNDLDGPLKMYYPDGSLKNIRNYSQGYLDGPFVQYHKNGKVEDSTFYEIGSPKGVSQLFNEKGIKTGDLYFVDGEYHGARKFYGEEKGALQLIRYYNYGKLIGYSYLDKNGKEVPMIELPNGTGKVVSYFSNGQKGREMTYENGLNQGAYTAYYENGRLERKYVYLDDEIHGEGYTYFPDGTLKSETKFFHGYREGEKLFYKNGKLKEESTYKNGQREGERHYYDKKGKKTKTEIYFNEEIIASQSF